MVPGRAAMRDITRVSGVTFRKVPWDEADIHVVLRKRNDGELLGQTRVTHTSIIETARVSIFPRTYRHDRDTERDVFQHEFGHALGLGHVKDPDDLMAKRMVDDPDESGWAKGLGNLYSQC
jgi:predicted Zn-dependent protease